MEPRSKDHWISTSTKTAVCNMFCTTQPKLLIFNSVFSSAFKQHCFLQYFWKNAPHKTLQLTTNKCNLCSLQQKQDEPCKNHGICSVSSDCFCCPILDVRTAQMTLNDIPRGGRGGWYLYYHVGSVVPAWPGLDRGWKASQKRESLGALPGVFHTTSAPQNAFWS